jgi:hypothetical protein
MGENAIAIDYHRWSALWYYRQFPINDYQFVSQAF